MLINTEIHVDVVCAELVSSCAMFHGHEVKQLHEFQRLDVCAHHPLIRWTRCKHLVPEQCTKLWKVYVVESQQAMLSTGTLLDMKLMRGCLAVAELPLQPTGNRLVWSAWGRLAGHIQLKVPQGRMGMC